MQWDRLPLELKYKVYEDTGTHDMIYMLVEEIEKLENSAAKKGPYTLFDHRSIG